MILGVLQARMSSTRFPGKILERLMDRPMMSLQIERLRRSRRMDRVIVATSNDTSDDVVVEFCARENIGCYRGPLDDVLSRVHDAAVEFGPVDHVVRLTADCPLADWEIIDQCIQMHLSARADYTSNTVQRTYPDGLDVEVIAMTALGKAYRLAPPGQEREHVTMYLYQHPELFKVAQMVQEPDLADLRWTVDTPADFKLITDVFGMLLPTQPHFLQSDVLSLFGFPIPRAPELVFMAPAIKVPEWPGPVPIT
jgi:spore coat polysaccharide biosynthesis protein SpsF